MVDTFKVVLCLLERKTKDHVCFKIDGGRFHQNESIKMNSSTEYEMRITVYSGKDIGKLVINGENYSVKEMKQKCTDETMKTFTSNFNTDGFEHCKNGKRRILPVNITFTDGSHVNVTLQCKMYKFGEEHHVHWGTRLTSLDIECSLEHGYKNASIVNEKYL